MSEQFEKQPHKPSEEDMEKAEKMMANKEEYSKKEEFRRKHPKIVDAIENIIDHWGNDPDIYEDIFSGVLNGVEVLDLSQMNMVVPFKIGDERIAKIITNAGAGSAGLDEYYEVCKEYPNLYKRNEKPFQPLFFINGDIENKQFIFRQKPDSK